MTITLSHQELTTLMLAIATAIEHEHKILERMLAQRSDIAERRKYIEDLEQLRRRLIAAS
jgi:hypothetical protein